MYHFLMSKNLSRLYFFYLIEHLFLSCASFPLIISLKILLMYAYDRVCIFILHFYNSFHCKSSSFKNIKYFSILSNIIDNYNYCKFINRAILSLVLYFYSNSKLLSSRTLTYDHGLKNFTCCKKCYL